VDVFPQCSKYLDPLSTIVEFIKYPEIICDDDLRPVSVDMLEFAATSIVFCVCPNSS
jgi:hypothetical protein